MDYGCVRICSKKRPLFSSMCVCPSVRRYPAGSHWADFHEIWHWRLLWKLSKKLHFVEIWHFTWRPKYVSLLPATKIWVELLGCKASEWGINITRTRHSVMLHVYCLYWYNRDEAWTVRYELNMPTQLRSVRVGFVADKFALGDVFIRALQISPVSIIPPLPHTHLRHVAFSRKPNGRRLITLENATHFANRGAWDRKVPTLSSFLKG